MMRFKGFLLLIAITAATAALWPAAGSAGTFKGVVVAKQRGTLLVASPSGLVQAVTGRASIGSRVASTGGHATVVGRASKAHIRGIVVRRIGTTLFLSSNRHLVAIHNRVGRRLADTTPAPASPAAPAPGAVVTTDVTIANGQLEEDDEDEVGHVNANSITVQATVKAVAAGSVTLDVQGQTLTVPLPAGLTLPASIVGQTVTISLSLANDDDENDDDDDGDHHDGHGSDGGDDHGGDDHGGHGGGDD
jgi:hypothetical protein